MTENESEEIEKTEQPQADRQELEKDEQLQAESEVNDGSWRFWMFTILPLIPIVTGVVCFIVGNTIPNRTVTYIGMLAIIAFLPAIMLILLIVGLIWKFGGSRKSKSDTTATTEETSSQREHEQNVIDAVNSASYYGSRAKLAAYETESIIDGMKNAPKWGMPVGIGIFLLLVADVVVATVLAIKGIFVGTIICAALFAGSVITGLIVMSVSRAKAMNGDIRKAQKILEGKVKACFMIGTTTMKTGGNRYQSVNGKTVRITGVTYRVIVIADGEEYGTFSKRFYETDENVTIAVMGNKRAKIVEDPELEKIETE